MRPDILNARTPLCAPLTWLGLGLGLELGSGSGLGLGVGVGLGVGIGVGVGLANPNPNPNPNQVSGGLLPARLRGTTNPTVFSITDWYPTFCNLAGADPTDDPVPGSAHGGEQWPSVDGVDIWPMLTQPEEYAADAAHPALAVTSQVLTRTLTLTLT